MQKSVLFVIIGVFIGGLLTYSLTSRNTSTSQDHMKMMKSNTNESHMNMSMSDMTQTINKLEGDDFDKAFIELMIDHHQGAIDMAKEANEKAKHQEIKDLAREIIEAQNREINQMKQWQTQWEY